MEGVHANTLKYGFPTEAAAKAFVRAVTLQFETAAFRSDYKVWIVCPDDQIRPVYEMTHNFGGWPE